MKTSHAAALVAMGTFGLVAAFPDAGRATDLLIEATADNTWKFGKLESGGVTKPLMVPVKTGDVLQFKVLGGSHGVQTLDGKGSASPKADHKYVRKCGETAATKPDAVLAETGCPPGNASFYDKVLPREMVSLKLEVLGSLKSDVHFWCKVHKKDMWGTITPSVQAPPPVKGSSAPNKRP